MIRDKTFILLMTLLALLSLSKAQNYSFRQFGLEEGLPDKFSYTLCQDAEGFLWISTTNGLCRFDGMDFDTEFRGDTLPQAIAYASLLDSKDRLWMGYDNGELAVLDQGSFRLLKPACEANRRRVNAIREDRSGKIFVLKQQNGLQIFDPGLDLLYESPCLESGEEAGDQLNAADANPFMGLFLYDFQFLPSGELLVGSQKGLSLFLLDERKLEFTLAGDFPGLDYVGVVEIEPHPDNGSFWIGTQDEGIFILSGTGSNPWEYQLDKLGEGTPLEYATVSSIVFDGDHSVWVNSNGEGIYRLRIDKKGELMESLLLNESSGLPSNYINELFLDEEGNQWFSTQGQGIANLRDQAFTFIQMWEGRELQSINSICVDGTHQWYGGEGSIVYVDPAGAEPMQIYQVEQGLPQDVITALYLDKKKNLYIGTQSSGLYFKGAESSRVMLLLHSGNSLQNRINAIDGEGEMIYVGTNNGVYTYNTRTREQVIHNMFSELPVEPLPHNRINDVLVDSKGRVWAASIFYGLPRVGYNEQITVDGKPKLEMKCLMEDGEGRIWAGTYGDGVYVFDPADKSYLRLDSEDGLKSDFCYALAQDGKGEVWVGHRMGFSKIDPASWRIQSFGQESGFTADARENAAAALDNGPLVFGTTEGLVMYDALRARADTLPPRLNIKAVEINGEVWDLSRPIRLKFGRYRIRIDYTGIDLGNPEKVTYQHVLQEGDDLWSEPTRSKHVTFNKVEDGKYTFRLKACDAYGNCSSEALELPIYIRIPFWKAWWFILTMVAIVFLAVFAVFKIRERNQKAIQEYLQRQLDERTREVVMQKEEIELKNRDITDSLNYAQRIQASILPPIRKLHDAFSGSFVFYQPRDIVSGDFYWYERIDNDRFIIVCADSTGHGVPGAFMSMIGTTLIKDICMRPTVSKPSQVLSTLDDEVRTALNQNVEASGSNDGMDIIVAEINLRTLKFKVSSAMRPVIIYSGDEQIYVKGSRSSIGGQLDDDRMEKNFIDQEFQLKRGDIVYMFSDGYPDQFGGPLGRKFKMVRLKNLLRDIHDKDMDEQYTYIKSNFFLWKEDLEQVDDVLFMGIKI